MGCETLVVAVDLIYWWRAAHYDINNNESSTCAHSACSSARSSFMPDLYQHCSGLDHRPDFPGRQFWPGLRGSRQRSLESILFGLLQERSSEQPTHFQFWHKDLQRYIISYSGNDYLVQEGFRLTTTGVIPTVATVLLELTNITSIHYLSLSFIVVETTLTYNMHFIPAVDLNYSSTLVMVILFRPTSRRCRLRWPVTLKSLILAPVRSTSPTTRVTKLSRVPSPTIKSCSSSVLLTLLPPAPLPSPWTSPTPSSPALLTRWLWPSATTSASPGSVSIRYSTIPRPTLLDWVPTSTPMSGTLPMLPWLPIKFRLIVWYSTISLSRGWHLSLRCQARPRYNFGWFLPHSPTATAPNSTRLRP